MYKTKKNSTVSIEVQKGNLKQDDYIVVGHRKPGPWIDTAREGKNLKSCKRMVFGLEICADHADGRVNYINKGANEIDIDIQLVPSAGMNLKLFATRTGGYLFNCDGWNQKPKEGGKSLEVAFDGPNPFVSKNPAFPHSAVAYGTGKGKMCEKCLEADGHRRPISNP
jgi:hypothetical protein